jgi:hypothetical protein
LVANGERNPWGASGTDVFVVGSYFNDPAERPAVILHYDGSVWSRMPNMPDPEPPNQTVLFSIWGTSSSNLYAVGTLEYGEDLILQYNGAAWTAAWTSNFGFGTSASLGGVWGPSDSEVFSVGNWCFEIFTTSAGGQIVHYSGGLWTPLMSLEAQGSLHGVWGTSRSDVFAVGCVVTNDGIPIRDLIQHFDGSSWSVMLNFGGRWGLSGVWGSSPTDVFAVGDRILHYDGSTWTTMMEGAFGCVWGRSSQDVFVVGGELNVGSDILHYDGLSWSPMIGGYPQVLEAVWGPAL